MQEFDDLTLAQQTLVEEKINEDLPRWIDELDFYQADAIQRGGCESGAYMPAVTYYDASQIMAEHGDSVLEFLTDAFGELPHLTVISVGHRSRYTTYRGLLTC